MKILKKILSKLKGEILASCPKCHTHFDSSRNGIVHNVVIKDENYRYVCKTCHKEHANEINNSKSN